MAESPLYDESSSEPVIRCWFCSGVRFGLDKLLRRVPNIMIMKMMEEEEEEEKIKELWICLDILCVCL